MEAKAPVPLDDFAGEPLPPILRAYLHWSHLKQLYRRGWLLRGIDPALCESVADHSFAVAVLAMFIADAYYPGLDRELVLQMALLHDLAEASAGDITPADGVAAEEKRRRECDALQRVLGDAPGADAYVAVWRAYEEGTTPEARLVREVDQLEMGLQAVVYERRTGLDLDEFLVSAARRVALPPVASLLDVLRRLKPGDPGSGPSSSRQVSHRPAAGGPVPRKEDT